MANRKWVFFKIMADAARLFVKNDPLRMAGATSFFTMFALPPILIILVQVFSLFINPATIQVELFSSLTDTFGKESLRQITSVITALQKISYNWFVTILGFIFLTFVATTLFKVIKNSINQLWDLPPAKEVKVMATIKSRAQSLLLILTSGLLFTMAVFIEMLQVFIGHYFFKILPVISPFFNQLQGFIISTLIMAIWFLIIFRYLSHGRPLWRIAWIGALFTSILFSFGKIILHILLTYNQINSIYGASASLVLLLLFLFYTSMILYYGASFTKVWADYKGYKMVHR
jgi:membrane protein